MMVIQTTAFLQSRYVSPCGKIQIQHTRYTIKETPFIKPTTWLLHSSRSTVKAASYSLFLEKSEGDHKSGQYVKTVKRMNRSINLFQIQDILNCFTETLPVAADQALLC